MNANVHFLMLAHPSSKNSLCFIKQDAATADSICLKWSKQVLEVLRLFELGHGLAKPPSTKK